MAGYIVPNMQDYKHGFELKLLFIVFFFKLNQIKINKTSVRLQTYVTLQILRNLWIQSKIRRNVDEKVKIWKQRVSIFFISYCKPSCMGTKRHNYFNFFSPSIHWANTPERRFFFKITWQILSKLTKSVGNGQLPFYDIITKIWTFLFETSL